MQIPNLTRIGSHQKVTLTTSVFSPADVPDKASYLMIQTASQNIRIVLDGSTPTSTNGFQLKTTDEPMLIPLNGSILPNILAETSGAVVQYQFFGSK